MFDVYQEDFEVYLGVGGVETDGDDESANVVEFVQCGEEYETRHFGH